MQREGAEGGNSFCWGLGEALLFWQHLIKVCKDGEGLRGRKVRKGPKVCRCNLYSRKIGGLQACSLDRGR